MTTLEILSNVDFLEAYPAEDLLAWAYDQAKDRAALVTSFQHTGCVMIDMISHHHIPLRVVTVDTLRLHRETYEVIDQIEQRYGIRVERFTPERTLLDEMIRTDGEFLFFDSKAKQEKCCYVRKVEPMRRVLETLDIWITGLRRDQNTTRAETPKAKWVSRNNRTILRLCPLADWTDDDVRQYIENRAVPHNPLYKKGYTSIGCEICSTPVLPHEPPRAGRWRWFNYLGECHTKECGIHTDGSGI